MLYLYQSNSINQLKAWLVDKLCKEPLTNPFLDEQILVQSPGMAQWLRQQIALSSGIAAAVDFPMPASFIWKMFQKQLPDVPEVSAFSKETMTWKIMHLLPECLKDPSYAPLQHYLYDEMQETSHHKASSTQDHDATIQVKSYQLAEKIADTFDQYLVYRPEWIRSWEQGNNLETITRHHVWQPLLWRKLTEYTREQQQSHWHRGNLYTALVSALNKTPASHEILPKRLFVFGLSTLPPAYIEVLQALSEHFDVYLMVHNPCQYYWGDTKHPRYAAQNKNDSDLHFSEEFIQSNSSTLDENNALLASMGKLGRDYHALLSEIETLEDDNFIDPLEKQCMDHQPPTVLAQIQSHILNLEEANNPVIQEKNDNSLIINSCHSALREAEVLHDHLLDLLKNDPSLTPKDIIIMAPDVEAYSPAIQAVFSSTPSDRNIPFAISDRNARRENPMLEALLKLLNSHRLRCTINDIMTLLEVPSIMRHYNIQPKQLSTLQHWITTSGIRWGLDTEQQVQQSLPAQHQNTWRFGLERMLLGYAIEGEEALFEGRSPAQDIEGLNAALCGQLMEFIDQLQWLSNTLNDSRTASQWVLLINQVLDQFFSPDITETQTLQMVRDTLTSLCEQTDNAGFEPSISHPVIFEWLTGRLDQHSSKQRFLSGKVNVCTLMPMRSIPFKVICLLGMNDGMYPRSIPPSSFDLISKNPRRGDRSRRDDDRYLFLEALLAAEKHLYISYNGRDIKDNAERPPSVLLSELINYCQRNFNIPEKNKDSWVTQYPLQPFSREYFQPSSNYFTYSKEWLSAITPSTSPLTAKFIDTPLPSKEPDSGNAITTIDLDELLRFYRHPCKYFFQQRLGVTFEELESPAEDDEPFDIAGLDQFNLQSSLLEQRLSDIPIETSLQVIKALGKLPHSHFGTFSMQTLESNVNDMYTAINPYLVDPKEDHEVRLCINGFQLNGWIKGVYGDTLVRYRPSKNKNKFLVSCLIEHLVWCATADNPGETHIFYLPQQKKHDSFTTLQPIPQEQSIGEVEKLLEHFKKGQNEPLLFLPSISATWVQLATEKFKRTTNEEKLDKAREKTKEAFEKEKDHDDYIQRVWPELHQEELEHLATLAETLLGLVTHRDPK